MDERQVYDRKSFFGQFFSLIKRGMANHVDAKLAKKLDAPPRPPGALEEIEFLSACTRCKACADACPFGAIQTMPLQAGISANTPFIDPRVAACQLCEEMPCIAACGDGALTPVRPDEVRIGRARVAEKHCLTYRDKVCTLCYDACPFPERAITIGEDFHPRILDECTGCGQCQQACPPFPKGVEVLSMVRYRAAKMDDELYFGLIPKGEDDGAPPAMPFLSRSQKAGRDAGSS